MNQQEQLELLLKTIGALYVDQRALQSRIAQLELEARKGEEPTPDTQG